MAFVSPVAAPSQLAEGIFDVKTGFGAVGDGVADDTAAITAAITAVNAATNGGTVNFPPGVYKTSGGHPALSQKARIQGAGVTSTTINHTGNNTCFQLTAPGVTNERIGVTGILLQGNAGAVAVGIECRDVNFGAYLTHVRILNYTGAAGVALLLHNFAALQFTEGVQLDDVSMSNNQNAIAFFRTGGTVSFNATHFKNVAINVPNNGTAISVGAMAGSAACTIYNATFGPSVQIWFDNHTNNFGIDIGNGSVVVDTIFWVHGEGLSGSSKVVRIQAACTLAYWGSFQFGKDATWTVTGTAYQMLWAPSSVGNDAVQVGIAVAPQGAVNGVPVLGVSAYNSTTPYLPNTVAGGVCGFDKNGELVCMDYQANMRLRTVNNVLEYRDPNSLLYPLSEKMIAIAESAGGGATIDASLGTSFQITVADGTAFTISNPTNAGTGRAITIIVFNNSGGALGAVTFGVNFTLQAAWTSPIATKRRSISFVFDSVAGKWWETGRTTTDM